LGLAWFVPTTAVFLAALGAEKLIARKKQKVFIEN
jgi:hypothetical protein